jgi:2-polyprenyl-3-methyl-5-hydroxy-6-metoxy-1,4-benzoquinol methylase
VRTATCVPRIAWGVNYYMASVTTGPLTREPEYGERWDVFCAIPFNVRAILDVGCGKGRGFLTYHRRSVQIVGVDNHAPSIEAAREHMDEALVLDLENDQWPDGWRNRFDVVAFCDCLEHLTDPWRVLASVRPLLSERGVVVASIPNIRQWRLIVKLALGQWNYLRGTGTIQRGHYHFFTKQTIVDMFSEAGYESPTFFWPWKTYHLRFLERVLHVLTFRKVPDLWYGSYTVAAYLSH